MHDEDPADYEELALRFQADLKPVGAVERALTDLIVVKLWRLARFARVEQGLFEMYRRYQGVEGGVAVGFANDASQLGCFERLSRCEMSLERGLFRALAELKKLQVLRLAQTPVESATVEVGSSKLLAASPNARSPSAQEGRNGQVAQVIGLSRGFLHRLFNEPRTWLHRSRAAN